MTAFDYDVFLSHTRLDREWVRNLAGRLERRKMHGKQLRVFFADSDLAAGANIPDGVERALRTSRKVVVVISPEALHSEWVTAERTAVLADAPAGAGQRLIPVLLRGSEEQFPPLLRALKFVDFRIASEYERRFDELLRAIRDEPVSHRAEPMKPAAVAPVLRGLILSEADNKCALCHADDDVDLYPVDPSARVKAHTYETIVPLCASCRRRLERDALAPLTLRDARDSWRQECRRRREVSDLSALIEANLAEARRLSITATDVWDITRARLLADEVIARFDPANVEARLLSEKLKVVGREMDSRSTADVRVYDMLAWRISKLGVYASLLLATALVVPALYLVAEIILRLAGIAVPGWIVVSALSAVFLVVAFLRKDVGVAMAFAIYAGCAALPHEVGHLFGLYFGARVRNALGEKMPLRQYFKYIEVNEQPFWSGLRAALREARVAGVFPRLSFNAGKLLREWSETVNV